MKKVLSILVALVLLLGVAYTASAWFVGKQVEAALLESSKQMEGTPFIKVVGRDYDRGILTSTETVTVEVFGDMMKAIEQAQRQRAAMNPDMRVAPPQAMEPIRFTLVSRITHGPLPGISAVAAAVADSELEVDPRFRAALARVLGDRKVLTSRTVLQFDGSGESLITSPAFVTDLPADAGGDNRLAWDGVRMTVRFARNFDSYTMQGEAPKLELTDGAGGQLVVAGMRMEADQKRVFADEPLLYSGRQKFTISRIGIEGAGFGGKAVVLKQLAYDLNMPVSGEFVDIVSAMSAQELLVGTRNYGPARYDLSLKHLHARTLIQLRRAMMQAYADPAVFGANANPAALLAPVTGPAMKLLEHNPEISLDRISFRTADGEVLLAARIKLDDVAAEDFQQPQMLFAKLDAGADITLPESLLLMPVGPAAAHAEAAKMQLQTRQKQIAALVDQGYVVREGGLLKSQLTFRGGQFTVNGLPFDPMALQGGVRPDVPAPAVGR